jgi:hypothetical protein
VDRSFKTTKRTFLLIPIGYQMHVRVEAAEIASFAHWRPPNPPTDIAGENFPPTPEESLVVSCWICDTSMSALALEWGQLHKESADPFTHPVGEGRARHPLERRRVNGQDAIRRHTGVGGINGGTEGVFLVLRLQQPEENSHGWPPAPVGSP